jgi:hypothetical protein
MLSLASLTVASITAVFYPPANVEIHDVPLVQLLFSALLLPMFLLMLAPP